MRRSTVNCRWQCCPEVCALGLHSARKWFEKCLAEAEIKNFHWHDLRHTFATHLGAANVQFHHIEHLLGHDTDNITLR
jgi:integrase